MTENRIPSYEEALQLLAEKAQEGGVTAIVALERVLRRSRTGGAGARRRDRRDHGQGR
jgi:hypothetical protein